VARGGTLKERKPWLVIGLGMVSFYKRPGSSKLRKRTVRRHFTVCA
jgi:hypothetical protein